MSQFKFQLGEVAGSNIDIVWAIIFSLIFVGWSLKAREIESRGKKF
jgi:hypothetical protein